jgi:hypothetical protein
MPLHAVAGHDGFSRAAIGETRFFLIPFTNPDFLRPASVTAPAAAALGPCKYFVFTEKSPDWQNSLVKSLYFLQFTL